jgi:dTDP-4-amino-4,6-dideoxygalactose transaminase
VNTNKQKHAGKLALLGGGKAVKSDAGDMFTWPIVTPAHEQAVLDVIRNRKMSQWDITRQFEEEYAASMGCRYAIACNNGTAAIHCALYGLGVGVGDEVIAPSLTYWATCLPVFSLGATVVFAEVDPGTLCIDPADIERRITPRTKVIMPVHYSAMPADMDRIMRIARKHKLKVLEDCSHAHGTLYKGRQVGTFGDAAGFSLMTSKAFAIGEGGILFTDDRRVYERALLFGHYERHDEVLLDDLKPYAGIPCGGYKYRMHQATSAFGRVTLKLYPKQMAEIDRAMNRFCDLIEGTPGLRPIRPAKGSGSTRGGWYNVGAKYVPEELGGLSVQRFVAAVRAEGSTATPGCNRPLHTHPVFNTFDIYGHGRPTRLANLPRGVDIRQPAGSLRVTEGINARVVGLPWFKHDRPRIIREHAAAFRKVAANYRELLAEDSHAVETGAYTASFRKQTV